MGGPDHMSARVGTCANPSLMAAHLSRVRETWPAEVWARTGRIQLASAFLASLLSGKWQVMTESEACATGMWVHKIGGNGHGEGGGFGGHWDDGVLELIGNGKEEGRRIRGWLGDVDVSGASKKAGNVSKYLVERYGFDPGKWNGVFNLDRCCTYSRTRCNCYTIHF